MLTLSTQESLYSTIKGFCTVEISSICITTNQDSNLKCTMFTGIISVLLITVNMCSWNLVLNPKKKKHKTNLQVSRSAGSISLTSKTDLLQHIPINAWEYEYIENTSSDTQMTILLYVKCKHSMILTSSFRAYASQEEQNQKNLSQSALEFHTGPSYALPLSFFTVLKMPIFLQRMHKTMRGLTVTDTYTDAS